MKTIQEIEASYGESEHITDLFGLSEGELSNLYDLVELELSAAPDNSGLAGIASRTFKLIGKPVYTSEEWLRLIIAIKIVKCQFQKNKRKSRLGLVIGLIGTAMLAVSVSFREPNILMVFGICGFVLLLLGDKLYYENH